MIDQLDRDRQRAALADNLVRIYSLAIELVADLHR